jgi:hypothetical protein
VLYLWFPIEALCFAIVSLLGPLWWKLPPCSIFLTIAIHAWSFQWRLDARAEATRERIDA